MFNVEQQMVADFVAVLPRVFARDYTVFADTPTDVSDRLNWLVAPDVTDCQALEQFAAEMDATGVDHLVLCGMGGSSLYARTLLPYRTHPRKITVLDTTHPDVLRRLDTDMMYRRSLFLFASKSGSTTETVALRAFFASRMADATHDAHGRLGVITDPGSPFALDAQHRKWRHILLADPKVGGRFSAHTLFGLTTAAASGIDVSAHVAAARRTFAMLAVASEQNVAVLLAAQLTAAVRQSGGVATVALALRHLDDTYLMWVEQLLAESLGKNDTGLHVVTSPYAGPVDVLLTLAADHSVNLPKLHREGHKVTLLIPHGHEGIAMASAVLMLATALVGRGIGVNPFDQPDVAAAKQATRDALTAGSLTPQPCDLNDVLNATPLSTPLVLLAYVAPDSVEDAEIRRCAADIGAKRHTNVTVGLGPQYLHATGQLHKGALRDACYLVIAPTWETDVPIADLPYTFGELISAQAAGDVAALALRGRQVHVTTTAALTAYCLS